MVLLYNITVADDKVVQHKIIRHVLDCLYHIYRSFVCTFLWYMQRPIYGNA